MFLAVSAAVAQQVGPQLPSDGVWDLKRAIETARLRNPAVAAAAARVQAAASGVAATAAEYRPRLESHASVGGTLAGDRTVVFRDDIAARGFDANPFYTAVLRVVIPVVREGRLTLMSLPSQDVAQARHDVQKYGQNLTIAETLANVKVAFLVALSSQQDVEVSQRLVELREVQAADTRRRFQQQLIPQVDVLQAESALITARADLEVARTNAARNIEFFANAVGIGASPAAVGDIRLVDREDTTPAIPSLDEVLRASAARHPSVLAQDAKVREATAALAVLKTNRYPTLDGVVAVGTIDDFRLPTDAWSFRAGMRLSWNIFDFGALNLKIKEQADIVEAEKRLLEQVRNQVAQPVIKTYHSVTGDRAKVASAEKAVELAEEQARDAQRRFQQNLIPRATLLQAETNLATSRKTLIQARYTLRVDQALLEAAMGVE